VTDRSCFSLVHTAEAEKPSTLWLECVRRLDHTRTYVICQFTWPWLYMTSAHMIYTYDPISSLIMSTSVIIPSSTIKAGDSGSTHGLSKVTQLLTHN
jgi:hypothetical protein